ncbi:hypothetical protein G9A89_002815 [Geosiphon pyriformis]|nr:hypothetical protein G9A89_002815 [Geosiphon pyriformis]
MIVYQLIPSSFNQSLKSSQQSLRTRYNQNLSSQNYLSLLITPEDASSNNLETNQKNLTNNIPSVTITNDKLLAAIFSFEFKKLSSMPLFSGAILKKKPITTMYTDAKINGHSIKLILDSGSADSIITRQLMDQLGRQVDQAASTRIITADGITKTPIGEINNLLIEIDGIIISIKVLVIKATQYQALVNNNWLLKTNPIHISTSNIWPFQIQQYHKHIKSCGLKKTTMSCHQYCRGTIAGKKNKKKNLSEIPTKLCGLTMTIKSYHKLGNGKRITKKKKKQEKKKWSQPILLINHILIPCYHKNVNLQSTDSYNIQKKRPKTSVVTTPDTTTLEYYQLIYTHCKQRFNIPDGIEIVERTLYQYIENCINNYLLGNYNISEVRSNLYNNLVHYLRLRTKDLNSETLAIYFQELNYNIIKYCEEKYPVQSKYSFDFESETETDNKSKQKVKQHSKTAPNTPILPKTTAKHLQTPEQGTSQEPISTSTNIIEYLQENESDHSKNLKSEKTESEQKKATENEEKMATAYIAKIPEFTGKDNDTSPQEWLDKVQKAEDANGWNAARMLKAIPYFLQGTAGEWFENLEEPFENWQAFKDAFLQQFTNNNTSITLRNRFHNIKQETFETFIAGLKNKLIKKVCPHAPADLATAIRHAKNYKMAMKEANHTKLVNLAIGKTSLAAEKKIYQLTKKIPPTQQYQVPARRLVQHNQSTSQNQLQSNNNRINPNNQLVLQNSDEIAAPRSNPFNHTILPAQIAQNANLSDIFPFEFEANESPFLLSNAAVNEQKAITAMYTEATVERKPIHLILDSGLAGSIITYQLMQQLKRNVDRPAQTVIVTADGIKKTPVGKIDDFLFTIDKITISVKVLVIDAPQYQALVRNDWLLKANANLN